MVSVTCDFNDIAISGESETACNAYLHRYNDVKYFEQLPHNLYYSYN